MLTPRQISKEQLKENFDLDNPYDTLESFLHGGCEIFAYVLRINFDYPIFCLKKGVSYHFYCRYEDLYIDVRGKMVFTEFIKEFPELRYAQEEMVDLGIEKIKKNEKFYLGLGVADQILDQYTDYYS